MTINDIRELLGAEVLCGAKGWIWRSIPPAEAT